jgi:hypothetical protein
MTEPEPFDPDSLRLPPEKMPEIQVQRQARPPRHRPGEWFLKGPIPWPWLDRAARLPGSALAVSLALWREVGRRKRCTVRLCLGHIGLGVSEQAARRALRALEGAGLLSVRREPGHGLEITLLEAIPEQEADG